MAAHGGWIATPTDLLRLLGAMDGLEDPPDILSPSTIRRMMAPPQEGVDTAYFGMGWMVRPAEDGLPTVWWHVGDLPGTTALLMRSGRTSWALLVNRWPWGPQAHAAIRDARIRSPTGDAVAVRGLASAGDRPASVEPPDSSPCPRGRRRGEDLGGADDRAGPESRLGGKAIGTALGLAKEREGEIREARHDHFGR